ncbi:MAG: TrkH family potassium uptake protein [Candidatus Sumerlaeia bacterium]|nr:TrkH family potassium uptake protein [Candidatus Sumerlaeia bacterium]
MVFAPTMLLMIPFIIWWREWSILLAVAQSMAICLLFGFTLYMIGRKTTQELFRKEALATVGFSWISLSIISALPIYFGGMASTFTDAFFESTSGITTTGATILGSIETQPRSLIFWRAFLHFVGGLGIVVFFIAILPLLGAGGKSLFKQEAAGPIPEGFTPRIKDTAINLCKLYIGLNVVCFLVLLALGLSYFDALCHAMSLLATGGYSNRDASAGHFGWLIQWVFILFMFIGATNFRLHLRFIKGDFLCYFKSEEFRLYCAIILGGALILTLALFFHRSVFVSNPGGLNLRDGLFSTITIVTTTGFGTVDYDMWPQVCRMTILILMFTGGMAGSTSGGMKVVRLLLLWKIARFHLSREASPNRVRTLKIDGRNIDKNTIHDTLVYFFVHTAILVAACLVVALIMESQPLLTTISAVVSCVNNIGPGLELVGPMADFSAQATPVKWILSCLMLLGRLEHFVLLVLFSPSFWTYR